VDEQDPDLEDTVGYLKHAQHSIGVATAKINSTKLPRVARVRTSLHQVPDGIVRS
jgi:hypothetical protein